MEKSEPTNQEAVDTELIEEIYQIINISLGEGGRDVSSVRLFSS